MKRCEECGKKLGIIEGYRHPTLGKKHLLCRHCYDSVYESLEKYREFLSPYFGFFNKESQVTDFQAISSNIKESILSVKGKVSKAWLNGSKKNVNKTFTTYNSKYTKPHSD
jgi:hypothetical protein